MVEGSQSGEVLLLGFPPDLREVLEVMLAEDGYSVRARVLDAPSVATAAEAPPGVIVLMMDVEGRALNLLDSLRATPETAAVPVVVLTTMEAAQVQAQVSGNVYATLPMPFDLQDLQNAVDGALARTPFEARIQQLPLEPDPTRERAADLLIRAEREIMLNWVQHVRQLEPFQGRADLSTREFLDGLPRMLNALVLVLRRQLPLDVLLEDEDARSRVRAHADVRYRQGIPAESVVYEYQVLREVMTKQLRNGLAGEEHSDVLDELNRLLDGAVRLTVAEYIHLGGNAGPS